MLVDRVRIMV